MFSPHNPNYFVGLQGLYMSITNYWKTGLRQVPGALGEGHFTLGEGFAKCHTRRRALGQDLVGEAIFAECQISGTWRSLRQVPGSHLAKRTEKPPAVIFAKWGFGTWRRLRQVPKFSTRRRALHRQDLRRVRHSAKPSPSVKWPSPSALGTWRSPVFQ